MGRLTHELIRAILFLTFTKGDDDERGGALADVAGSF